MMRPVSQPDTKRSWRSYHHGSLACLHTRLVGRYHQRDFGQATSQNGFPWHNFMENAPSASFQRRITTTGDVCF